MHITDYLSNQQALLDDYGYPGHILTFDKEVWICNKERFATKRKDNAYLGCINGNAIIVATGLLHKQIWRNYILEIPEKDKFDLGKLGFPGYWITRCGRVWSNRRFMWLKPKLTKNGYLRCTMGTTSKECKHMYVHRLAALAFHPNPENKPEVNHKDGDKTNNNDWNLEWNTSLENIEAGCTQGLMKWKLIDKDVVAEVCSLLRDKCRTIDIAQRLDVSYSFVSNIKMRRTYKSISKYFYW